MNTNEKKTKEKTEKKPCLHAGDKKALINWARVEMCQINSRGCWCWTGGITSKGYGSKTLPLHETSEEVTSVAIHRASYEVFKGPPGKLQVQHTCDNRICFNPAHLILGDEAQNARDAAIRGRLAKVLSPEEVCEIRTSYAAGGVSFRQLASQFGVSHALIYYVVHRKNWKYV